MFKHPTSVKYIFSEDSSSESDSSSDDDQSNRRKNRSNRYNAKAKSEFRSSIKLPESFLTKTPTILEKKKTTKKKEERSKAIDEDGLFILDSTGGGGNVTIKGKQERKTKEEERPFTSPLDPGVDLTKDLYIDLDVLDRLYLDNPAGEEEDVEESREAEIVDEVMKKATFKPSMEKNPSLPRVSSAEQKRRRQTEREKTKGKDWFNLPATELTEERRRDLEIMQIRDALDPKSRYRSEDRKVLPKYFQIGTVVEHATDYYNSRVPRKERKQTIVDELLADAEFRKRSKRKYEEIQQEKMRHEKRYHSKKSDHQPQHEEVKKKKRKLKQ